MNSLRPSSEIKIYVYGEYEYAVLTNAAVNGGRSGQIMSNIAKRMGNNQCSCYARGYTKPRLECIL